MATINNQFIYDFINYVSGKTQNSNVLTPEQFPTVVHSASLSYFEDLVGDTKEYRPGMPFPSRQDGLTESIDNSLEPFKVILDISTNNPLKVNAQGIAQKPTDFYKRLSLSYWHIENKVSRKLRDILVVNDDAWVNRLSSALSLPTLKQPIANFQNNYIRFYPLVNTRVNFTYRKLPVKPIYDYYITSIGEYKYLAPGTSHTLLAGEEGSGGETSGVVASSSVELEWADIDKLNIISKILSLQGINIRDRQIIEYAELIKQKGI